MFIFLIACLLPARSITGGILAHYANFSRLAKNKEDKDKNSATVDALGQMQCAQNRGKVP